MAMKQQKTLTSEAEHVSMYIWMKNFTRQSISAFKDFSVLSHQSMRSILIADQLCEFMVFELTCTDWLNRPSSLITVFDQ